MHRCKYQPWSKLYARCKQCLRHPPQRKRCSRDLGTAGAAKSHANNLSIMSHDALVCQWPCGMQNPGSPGLLTQPLFPQEQVKGLITALMLSAPPPVRAQLSEALTLISGHDFPARWRGLLPELCERLTSSDAAAVNGVLETANSIFKRCTPAAPAAASVVSSTRTRGFVDSVTRSESSGAT